MDEEIWTCTRCGTWTADLAANATEWEQLAAGWVCPNCLTSAELLDLVEGSTPTEEQMDLIEEMRRSQERWR